jgi:hydrogenase nickel incorporation protein HypB
MVQNALNGGDLHSLDSVFVEVVGSLVSPSSYDFGEDFGFLLLSVTEGQDKPLTYPSIFNSPDVTTITKSDLADAVECDEAAARGNLQTVRPGLEGFRLSAKAGEGLREFLEFLEDRRTRYRTAAV